MCPSVGISSAASVSCSALATSLGFKRIPIKFRVEDLGFRV